MHHLLTEQLTTTPIEIAGGRCAVPTAPGLGFEIDLDAVERARERVRAAGAVLMDPITFEVIRNALVAATDEMVLTLRRSAYSTNIKTRSDFSCAFFDAELRAVAQGFTQPVHLGSMVEQVPRAILDYGPENLEPGDVIITNEPFPSGVHLNDISLISPVHHDGELLGYVANLAHHVDVGGGAPASIGAFREVFQEGVIIPPVKVVAGGRIVRDVFDLILAQIRSKHETGGRLPRPDRRQRDRRPQAAGARRPPRPRDGRRHDARAARLHRAAHARRDRGAAARRLRGGGHRRRGRVHRRAGAAEGADRDHGRRRRLRPDRLRPAAPRARQLHLRADVLGLRLRGQVPDRPRPARQRRLLPRRQPRRAGGDGDELHLAEPGRRRLGDADAARRRDLPRAPPRAARAAARGDEGDDVPRRLRRRRRADERVLLLPRDVRRRLRRPLRERRAGRGADARPEHRERAGRGDRAELSGAGRAALARRGLGRAGSLPRRARAAQGLRLRPRDDVHRPRRPHARGAGGRVRRPRRASRRSTC